MIDALLYNPVLQLLMVAEKIKSTGMLWELFPDAPEFWEEIKK